MRKNDFLIRDIIERFGPSTNFMFMFDNMLSIRVCAVFWIRVGSIILGEKHFAITISKKWLT